jgi:histidinol-phosphate aminotransferase
MATQKRYGAARKNKRLASKRNVVPRQRTGDPAQSAKGGRSRTKATRSRTEAGPLSLIKPEIRRIAGYVAPPQGQFRAKLNQNENPYDIPPGVKQDILAKMQSVEWTRYPDYNPLSVRAALAKRLALRPEQILLAGGSNVLLYMIGLAVVSPGDSVVLTPPTFGLFELIGQFYKARMVPVDQKPGFGYDMDRLVASARKAKVTLLCSPNNPVGNTVPLETLEALLKAAKGLVLWDEAYTEFCGQSALPLLEKYPHLIILRTFSKAFGLAGLRLGYLMGRPELIAEFSKVNIPYNVNLFSEITALHLLNDSSWYEEGVRQIVRERDNLFNRLTAFGRITAYPSEANFILIRVPDGRRVFESLKTRGVLLRMVNGHPLLKDCLRVTVGTPEENRIFLEALHEVLREV